MYMYVEAAPAPGTAMRGGHVVPPGGMRRRGAAFIDYDLKKIVFLFSLGVRNHKQDQAAGFDFSLPVSPKVSK